MAEQLAPRGIINQAEALLERCLDARRFDPSGWEERDAFLYAPGSDDVIASLFDELFDGIDQSAGALHLGMDSPRIDDWFTLFDEVSALVGTSPFARDVTREAGGMTGEGYR